jgi:tRNA pseudouridine55 synthase
MNGVLVVDKPAGPTSHDVVARVRRILRISRVGHTGTLDPLATGVLPLVVGRATRLAQFLSSDQKEYEARVRFGIATDTYDAVGQPIETGARNSGAAPGAASIEAALEEFRGTYPQMPPPFSAKKVSGTPAYKLARARSDVALEAVPVTVYSLELTSVREDAADLRIVCSSGFYVRTLAHDLGERLGCGAHLAALRRTRAGDFTIGQAAPLDELERDASTAADRIVPMERLLPSLPHVVVNDRGAKRAAHGNDLAPGDLSTPVPAAPAGRLRVIDGVGSLVGIARPEPGGLLRPVIVLV